MDGAGRCVRKRSSAGEVGEGVGGEGVPHPVMGESIPSWKGNGDGRENLNYSHFSFVDGCRKSKRFGGRRLPLFCNRPIWVFTLSGLADAFLTLNTNKLEPV
ncbi:hypothetical protein TNCV_3093951 [Trichonephila clavipes]|nr:hypothetical protein TNCV_3093951 [Trichonephila clavipes]